MARSEKFGAAKIFRMACPAGLIRAAGMMLPGNSALLSGSRMVMRRLFRSTDCEKFPSRSRAVGMVREAMRVVVVGQNSWPQKKNSFSRLRLNLPGTKTGPPTL